jgi:hypothetical protein
MSYLSRKMSSIRAEERLKRLTVRHSFRSIIFTKKNSVLRGIRRCKSHFQENYFQLQTW